MDVADLIAGLAAVVAGVGGFVRQGAPFARPWRLWMALWADAAALSTAVTLALIAPVTLIETPLAVVAGFALWELCLALIALRLWAGRTA
jgi:hypothetical protein